MKATIITAIATLTLVGCTTVGPPSATTMKFMCDRSDPISVSFYDDKAMLNFSGGSATLGQQPSGSGFRYAGQSHEIRGKGIELIWTKPDGATRSCREEKWAMQQPQTQQRMPTLAASNWRLVHFQSSDDSIGIKVPPSVERYNIAFMADGNLALQLDCNRVRSTWKATPSSSGAGSITLKNGPMTRAMCQPGAMDMQIARDLTRVRSYTFDVGRLSLALEADGGIYLWEKQN